MSDSGITRGCLVHYNGEFLKLNRDFYDLCIYNKDQFNQKKTASGKMVKDEPNRECMAKILRILESLTNKAQENWYIEAIDARKKGLRIPPEPTEYKIDMSYEGFAKLMYRTHGESIIRNSIACLVQWGYIKKEQSSYNSVPTYVLNTKFLQDALKKQAEISLEKEVLKSTPILKRRGRPKKEKLGVEIDGQPPEIDRQLPDFDSQTSDFDNSNISNKKSDKNLERKVVRTTTSPLDFSEKLSSEGKNIWEQWRNQSRFDQDKPELNKTSVKRCEEIAQLCQDIHFKLDSTKMGEIERWGKLNIKYLKNNDWELGNLKNTIQLYNDSVVSQDEQETSVDTQTPVDGYEEEECVRIEAQREKHLPYQLERELRAFAGRYGGEIEVSVAWARHYYEKSCQDGISEEDFRILFTSLIEKAQRVPEKWLREHFYDNHVDYFLKVLKKELKQRQPVEVMEG